MRYYYTPHTILQLLRVACEPSADHVVVVVMFTCFHIYLLSVRTLCDPLYLPTLILRGACNQGERFFIFILVASLVDTRSVACVSVTMKQCVSVSMCTHYTFKKVRAKKRPIKRPVLFDMPNQVFPLVQLQGIESLEQHSIALDLKASQ